MCPDKQDGLSQVGPTYVFHEQVPTYRVPHMGPRYKIPGKGSETRVPFMDPGSQVKVLGPGSQVNVRVSPMGPRSHVTGSTNRSWVPLLRQPIKTDRLSIKKDILVKFSFSFLLEQKSITRNEELQFVYLNTAILKTTSDAIFSMKKVD